ncbi:hypothetical protein BJF78_00400 [Pseudonocardia sp. CNS-139]|nr:hypothetical protein BJF78_00400 [Pseudonocardia sp. CNS-139]
MSRLDVFRARRFQWLFPVLLRAQLTNPALEFATKRIGRPERIAIPTRHGAVRSLVFEPTKEDLAALASAGRRPPVHLLVHGGAFIIRAPGRTAASPGTWPRSSGRR